MFVFVYKTNYYKYYSVLMLLYNDNCTVFQMHFSKYITVTTVTVLGYLWEEWSY